MFSLSGVKPLRVIGDSFPDDPALDVAVSRALLEQVAGGRLPETLRLSRPGPVVAFGKRDAVSPGYAAAASAAREGDFEAVLGLAGGRAAAFHELTIAFGHALGDPAPRPSVDRRFELVAGTLAAALRRLGVDARVGEVPGEYCPGRYSVNARGRSKLVGVSQRVIAGAVHVGGLVVVDGAERVREVLVPVYAALGLDWDPATAGSVADEVPGIGFEEVAEAIRAEYATRYELGQAELDEQTLALARERAADYRTP
jgi:octanoyl-[GcvH]:protein N-octanoyltransferase